MRKIKFRQKFPNGKLHYWGFIKEGQFVAPYDLNEPSHQYTEFNDKNGTEIYDGETVIYNGYPAVVHMDMECGTWCMRFEDGEIFNLVEALGQIEVNG